MTLDEDRALSRPDYWDGRYAHGDGHEWFRTYEDLEAFFQAHLFDNEPVSPKADPLILHLGSGDSVSTRPASPVPPCPAYRVFDRSSPPDSLPAATLASYVSTSRPSWSR